MIKYIFISNILESYYKTYLDLSPKEGDYWIKHDYMEANRALLYGEDDKVIVTSYPVHPENINYICDIAGWVNTINLYPEHPTYSICRDCLSGKMYSEIKEMILNNPSVNLIAYRNTPEFYKLVKKLKKEGLNFNLPEALDEDDRFISTYAHSKRGFRHLWEKSLSNKNVKYDIDIPPGFITSNKQEAIDACLWFFGKGKSFVVKYNFGASGFGLLMFDINEIPKEAIELKKYIRDKLTDNIWDKDVIVVEELMDVDQSSFSGSPNVELYIDENGVHNSYACEQVLDKDGKTFLGIYINPEVNQSEYMKTGFQVGHEFGNTLKDLGYRGIFDIDFVVTKDNKLFAVESNLRRTGGTHTHEFCRFLLGDDYFNHYYIISEDVELDKIYSYDDFLNNFKDYKYNKEKKEGFLLFNADMLSVKKASIIYIAGSKEKIEEMRQNIINVVKKQLLQPQGDFTLAP